MCFTPLLIALRFNTILCGRRRESKCSVGWKWQRGAQWEHKAIKYVCTFLDLARCHDGTCAFHKNCSETLRHEWCMMLEAVEIWPSHCLLLPKMNHKILFGAKWYAFSQHKTNSELLYIALAMDSRAKLHFFTSSWRLDCSCWMYGEDHVILKFCPGCLCLFLNILFAKTYA